MLLAGVSKDAMRKFPPTHDLHRTGTPSDLAGNSTKVNQSHKHRDPCHTLSMVRPGLSKFVYLMYINSSRRQHYLIAMESTRDTPDVPSRRTESKRILGVL